MDYFVRVMHGLGIITVATLTLEAGGDKGPRGLGTEPVPAHASRSSHPLVREVQDLTNECRTSTFLS